MGARDIVTNLITHDKASKSLKDAGKAAEDTARDYDDLSAAEQRLALNAEKAGVAVEKAALAAARAEERFGMESEQARTATRRLREAKLDLADAEEKVKRKAHEAADATEDVDRKTGSLRSKLTSLVPTLARNASGFGLLAMGSRGVGTALAAALPAVAGVTAGVSAFGTVALSAVGPMIALGSHIAAVGAAAAHLAVQVGPAAASLPGLAAGFLFAKATIGMAAPGIVKGLKPITEAFMGTPGRVGGKKGMIGGLQTQLQDLAGRGLPAVSKQFLKVNFPTIAQAMTRIAVATNGVVLAFGRWTTTIGGQRAIRAVVGGTATAVEALAPHVTALAIKFGELIGRAGPGAFERLSLVLGKVADAAGRFIDRISRQDVNQAWAQIDHYAGAVSGVLPKLQQLGGVVMGGVRWWRANADAIQHVRDVLGLVAISVGVATGGWIPAIVAGISLLIAHWDTVSAAMSRAKSWFNGTSDSAKGVHGVIDGLQVAVSELTSWFQGQLWPALERGARAVMPAIHDAIHMVSDAFNDNKDAIGKAKAIINALGIVITEAVIPAVTFLAQQGIHYLGAEFSGLIYVVNKVVLPGLRIFSRIILGILGGIVDGAAAAFGWVPGLGPQLKDAATKFDKFSKQVNDALSGIEDQTVNVKVSLTPAGTKVPSWYGSSTMKKAAGGMVAGPGGPRDDQVPAMLSNGEFVVNARSTARHRGLLEAINGYAHGGLVLSPSLSGVAGAQAAELGLARKLAASMPVYSGGSVAIGGLSPAERYIISHESGGRTTAANPGSTAFGIGQLLLANRQHYGALLGVSASTTDLTAQLAMFRMYVRDRYGTAENAASFWAAHHWYGNGGVINEPVVGRGLRSGGIYHLAEHGPETVVPGRHDTRQWTRAGGGVVKHETTVRVEVTASAATVEDRVVEGVRSAVRRGRLSTAVIPPGTRP